uniref:Vacuolar sorting protein 4b n=1 Tax=Arundo donax TaxID=35708 RepID=A0A0A9ET78_ARUDO
MTASCSACLALSRPATSFQLTLGFSVMIAELSPALSLDCSESSPPPPASPSLPLVLGRVATAASPPLAPGPAPPSSRTARISSARRRYSVNLAVMASLILGFFSYLRWVLKYSSAFM